METKKIKKRKLNIKKLLILILVVYLIGYGVYYVLNEPIRNIVISGNDLVSDADIINAAKIKNYPGIFSLRTKSIKKRIEKLDLIEEVSIKKDIKFRLIIDIKELKILFLNSTNNKLMLSSGNYIENDSKYLGYPVLINYAPEATLKELSTNMKVIDYGIISLINEIQYSPSTNEEGEVIDETRFILYMNDGNMIYTNPNKCSNLHYYREIYASLKDQKGVLYLDSGNYKKFVFRSYESIENEL